MSDTTMLNGLDIRADMEIPGSFFEQMSGPEFIDTSGETVPEPSWELSYHMANAQELRLAATQGDPERQARQRAAGKLTARERVERLVDPGSFVETDTLLGRDGDFAGVVTGCATVQDRPVCLFAQDFTVHGGAMGRQQAV